MPLAGFGYKYTETGEKEVIPEQLEALNKAAEYIYDGCGMYKVRDWLVNKTRRQITVPGMLKAIKYDKSRRKTPQERT